MASPWRVVAYPRTARDLDRVAAEWRPRVAVALRGLGTEPRPPGCRKLVGTTGGWRVRVGPYRVVYTVDDGTRTVTVVRIGHRGDVYR